MARSVWKGPFVDGYLLKKAEKSRASGRNEVIKTWSRRSTILPQFVGLTFGVYNGHKFIPVLVTENMIGHKFGEFSPTRTYYGHAADKKGEEEDKIMGKPKPNARRVADNEAMAYARNIRTSPQKLNLVAAMIRGKDGREGAGRTDVSRKRRASPAT